MDPAAVWNILKVIKTLFEKWQEYKAVVGTVKEFMGTLDLMMAVLHEQQPELVSGAGRDVLKSIFEECSIIEGSMRTFLERHKIVNFITCSYANMKAELKNWQAKLQNCMIFYMSSMSLAGSSPAALALQRALNGVQHFAMAGSNAACSAGASHLQEAVQDDALGSCAEIEEAHQVHTGGATVQSLLNDLASGDNRPKDSHVSSLWRKINLDDAELSRQPAMHVVQKIVRESDVQIESWELRAALESRRWDLQQAGTCLGDMTFMFPEHGGQLWVLNGNQGANWQNVTIEGKGLGSMVVVGKMVLDRVTFKGCTLVATDNAVLTVTNCRFDNCQVAVMAAGAGTSATFKSCTIQQSESGIVAASGAHVTIDAECNIACSGGGSCVMAHGDGALATVNGAPLSYAAQQISNCWYGVAAALCGGKTSIEGYSSDHGLSSVHRATVCGTGKAGGVVACGRGSKIRLKGCSVKAAGVSVWAVHGGQVNAQKCTVRGGTTGLLSKGQLSCVETSCVEATECAVWDCKGNCADVRQGGSLLLKQCTLERSSEGSGVNADGRMSSVTLDSCVVARNHLHGVLVQNSAKLTVQAQGQSYMQQRTVFSLNRLANVLATSRADVLCWGCNIWDSVTDHGMVADGCGTIISAENCMLTGDMQRDVVVAQNQARLEGVQLVVSGTTDAGGRVCTAATATLTEVTANECVCGSGVHVHGGESRVTIKHSVVHGNGVGMKAREGAKVTAELVQTWNNAMAGVVVDKISTVVLESCTCHDAMPYITPWEGGCMTRRNCMPV
eukprot:jgi/Ulvmu1/3709/UM170_0015.1